MGAYCVEYEEKRREELQQDMAAPADGHTSDELAEERVDLPGSNEDGQDEADTSERWRRIWEPESGTESESGGEETGRRFFGKKDAWYLGALMLVYTLLALYHLGGHQDPETFWKPARAGEALVADLGEQRHVTRINSFAGVGEGAYSYWFSADGKDWGKQTIVKSDHTQVLTWHTAELDVSARYVKISTDTPGFYLHEVGIFGEGGTKVTRPLPVAQVQALETRPDDQGEPKLVFDEPDVVPYAPTYMEGSYFDEIYHARTAYEHLHRIEPYESTHPPLGKILIAFGIWLFGLNPFGWRIVGTLFGVAMIPVMYLFAKRMFGRPEFALVAAFLLTFDFMHFAQTRIATIDVYGVFFIMLMFYYMYRYTTLSFYRAGLWKTLVPLGLSGLFFGIGAASKWIVIYGGAGLALLLALTLLERSAEYRLARAALREDNARRHAPPRAEPEPAPADRAGLDPAAAPAAPPSDGPAVADVRAELPGAAAGAPLAPADRERLAAVVRAFPRYTALTLLWCVLTFVIVPLTVYTLSYIPFMLVPGPGHGLIDVVTYQKHMYDYHKNLVATHPFSSPWWEWPLMLRPIWYYQGKLLPDGYMSSIVAFGNPLVWWPGFAAVVFSFVLVFKNKDKRLRLLLIAYCSQYLPWILVPRLTFIYHYFAMVPFMVLLLTYYIKHAIENETVKRRWIYVYLAGVVALFAIFYPILSGMVIPKSYPLMLRWLPGWSFF
ncbi:glycosyltransferase family 39 protein [Paenibacillus athensensis]|uniref:phospholipid carrier-dependent glycosyltransferase n=1 Tax=Paenibacillus athensensis TaxID=1967502 RepID=UPI00107047AC|nr:glycosyltransferase family 39 protein [Paenibacillus athensensis]MCD1260942.1 glycosyltransferase family 39 protein [Paenibacillus athensensis]